MTMTGWRPLTVALAAVFGLASAPAAAQQIKFFRIASGAAGGTYFPMAGMIANAVSNPPGSRPCDKGGSCGVPGLVAVAQSANGSVANVNGIQSGAIESGFSQSDVAYWAYTGTGTFAGQPALKKLRMIANLFPEHIHAVARKDAPYNAIAELKGKHISIGLQASGAKVGATLVLDAFAMKENVDYKAEYLNTQQSMDRLRDKQLDAMITVTGYPSSGIAELFSTAGGKLLPIPQAQRAAIIKSAPFYSEGVIPANTYKDFDKDVETLTVGAQWLVGADVDEALVYEITKALWNNNSRKLLDSGHAKGKVVQLKTAMEAVSIPVHPGAAKFYAEQGVKIPQIPN